MDAAFAKLDSNGDGYIDLEELLAQLPFEAQESYDGERLMEVGCCTPEAVVSSSQAAVRPVWEVQPCMIGRIPFSDLHC